MRFKASSPDVYRGRSFPRAVPTRPGSVRPPAATGARAWSIALLALMSACASAEPVLPATGAHAEVVSAYYDLVLADRAPSVAALSRRLQGSGAAIEPVGWTASGAVFATVLRGDLRRETVVMPASPRNLAGRHAMEPPRPIEVCRIASTDLPDYFAHVGESRPGFASLVADRVWLDERVTRDSDVLAATLWHEYQHLRDRRLYGRVSPALLEARGAVRELSTGLAVRSLLERLVAARGGGSETGHYREAAAIALDALAAALGAAPDEAAALAGHGDEAIASAADALAALAGF